MKRMALALVVCAVFAVATARADIIVLTNGNILHVDDAVEEGEFVVFFIFNGRMAIELTAVERIVKTDTRGSEPIPGVLSAGGGIASATIGGQRSAELLGDAASGSETGATDNRESEELVQFYIQQKQGLEREIYFYELQIQTLRSVIYSNSAIFSDTSEQRRQLAEMEEQLRQSEEGLNQLVDDARRAGLSPGDLRTIMDATFTPEETASREVSDEYDARGRRSDLVIGEEENDSRSRSTEDDDRRSNDGRPRP